MVHSLNVNVDRQAQGVTADHQDGAANSNKACAHADADIADSTTRQDHFDGFADDASRSKPATAVSSHPGKFCKQQMLASQRFLAHAASSRQRQLLST